MGCIPSKEEAKLLGEGARKSALNEHAANSEIEAAQRRAAETEAAKIHLMILGTGDSGKTTLRKQLVNVNTDAYAKPAFRLTFAEQILSNLIDGAVDVLTIMGDDEAIARIKQVTVGCEQVLTPKAAEVLIDIIWKRPAFQETIVEHRNKQLHLQDCFVVYSEELRAYPSWGGAGWVPSADDCIRSRARTSGVIKEELMIDGVPFILYDVGGQRSERRKWMHMFDNVTSVIFVAAASEYDQVLFEDGSMNRLQEALDLFGECVNSSWLRNIPTLLFLNKKDLFLKKFLEEKIPLNVSGLFPAAPSDNSNVESAFKWMIESFRERKIDKSKRKNILAHVTTATDSQNVRAVFKIAKDSIVKQSLEYAGF